MKKLIITLIFALLSSINIAICNDGYLGISVKNYLLDNQEGLRIIDVFDDGAAFVAGMKESDFITKVNNKEVNHPSELKEIVNQLQWGDEITIDYIRDGEYFTKEIALGYKAYTRTYEITKSNISGNSEEWYFKDNTTIKFVDLKPVSITKQIDGVEETLQLENEEYESVPQNFLDLSDKLFIIEETKRSQEERNVTNNRIVVFKEVISTEIPTSIINPFNYSEFKVYPNPSNGNFKVELTSSDMEKEILWTIYDIHGKDILQGRELNNNGNFEKEIKLSGKVAFGHYLLYIKTGDKRISSQFIVE